MKYLTGFECIVEETMERPDNEWCKKFFKNEGSENNGKTESAMHKVQPTNAKRRDG